MFDGIETLFGNKRADLNIISLEFVRVEKLARVYESVAMDEELGVDDDGGGVDRISNLPKEILYNILYFLPKRDAAQTCVLSKSWRFLWTNRLTVYFREFSYQTKGTRLFISRVNKFLRAHLTNLHNHRIQEFRLRLITNSKSIPLLKKWIPMLTSIGVNEFHLHITPKRTPTYMDLPSVVFKSECLATLDLERCNLRSLQKITKIHCVGLKDLYLHDVKFIDEGIFHEIISSCSLITDMFFRECQGLKTIKLDNTTKNLKQFTFVNLHTHANDECSIDIHIPTLESITIIGSKIRFHGHNKFANLKRMYLSIVKFSSDSFDWCSCYEFPRLGSLSLSNCYGWEQLLHINAPKLLYLHCLGRTIPSVTFTTPIPRACRSDIGLRFQVVDDPQSWFLKLSGFLQVLSQSQIFLSVYQHPTNIHIDIGDNKDAPVVVEQLLLNMGHLSSFPCYLNGLLSICRPRYIAQIAYAPGGELEKERDHRELTQFLCHFLTKKRSDSGNNCFLFRHDLEEMMIESFDMSREQWMSECVLPESNRIRFRLKWSEACDDESSSNPRMLES